MIIPNGYDARLTQLFDILASEGLVPTKRYRDFFRYEQEYSAAISNYILPNVQVIEFGCPSINYGTEFIDKASSWLGVETRDKKYSYIFQVCQTFAAKPKHLVNDLRNINIEGKSNVIIDFNWLASLSEEQLIEMSILVKGLEPDSKIIIMHFDQGELTQDNYCQSLNSNYINAAFWVKRESAIMHMGAPKYNFSDGSYWLLLST